MDHEEHTHDHRKHQHADGSDCHCEPEASSPVEAIDPVCGMTVAKDTAEFTASYRDQVYYFCSQGCRSSFVANPQSYVS